MAPGFTIGLISDTHGLLRPQAVDALHGSDRIIHAGDVGDPAILDALSRIAPVTAVHGNVDTGDWASALPADVTLAFGGIVVQVIHDVGDADLAWPGLRVVVSGHSHRPGICERDRVLFVNPGSAGPRRFSLPVSVGRLELRGDAVRAVLIELDVPRSR